MEGPVSAGCTGMYEGVSGVWITLKKILPFFSMFTCFCQRVLFFVLYWLICLLEIVGEVPVLSIFLDSRCSRGLFDQIVSVIPFICPSVFLHFILSSLISSPHGFLR